MVAARILNYNYTTVGAAPFGLLWRNLRCLTAVELLSTARLNYSLGLRHDEVRQLIHGLFDKVSGAGSGFGEVEMKSRLSGLSLNIVMRMVAEKRYFGSAAAEEEGGGEGFQEVISEVFELSGASNPGDILLE
ncbi:unnamed protein product [Linum trigynum]|uniref:Uncharacterized protein n=1 Tax=Linum trigynum TaxID=586398 RepID=A0AAV2CWK4_9ROSI